MGYLGEERLAFLVPQCQGAGGEQGQEYHQKLQVRFGAFGEKRGGWKTVHLLNITSLSSWDLDPFGAVAQTPHFCVFFGGWAGLGLDG